MELQTLLVFYIIIVVSMMVVLMKSGIAVVGSLILSLVIGQIMINLLYPANNIDDSVALSSTTAFYYMIQYVSPVIFAIALIHYSIKDRYVPKRYGPPVCTPYLS